MERHYCTVECKSTETVFKNFVGAHELIPSNRCRLCSLAVRYDNPIFLLGSWHPYIVIKLQHSASSLSRICSSQIRSLLTRVYSWLLQRVFDYIPPSGTKNLATDSLPPNAFPLPFQSRQLISDSSIIIISSFLHCPLYLIYSMVLTSPFLSYAIPDILIYEYLDATLQYMYCNACINGNYSEPGQHIQKAKRALTFLFTILGVLSRNLWSKKQFNIFYNIPHNQKIDNPSPETEFLD